MLDTNIVSAVMRAPRDSVVRAAFDAVPSDELCVSIITSAELKFGLANRPSEKLAARLDDFFSVVPVLPFDMPADQAYAELRAQLEKNGRPIGPNDLLIAAHAISLDLTLITANIREFSRVPNLRVENWLD